jgi:methionyl-tRNA formyltransferase
MKPFDQLRIVFFGTPDFAVASLKALVDAGANVVGVVTAVDKPAGRGKQNHASAVKEYAVANGLYLMQPEKMKADSFLQQLRACNADLQVVVAFRMMPEVVWNMPPMGTLNVHGSLLPQYRGAAPINRAIMNGETETGVTTFKLKHEIDTGDIMLQQKVAVLPDDTAGTMHDKLMEAGAELLIRTVKAIAEGTITEIPQDKVDAGELKNAPKIFKEDTLIHWDRKVAEINNFIRGLSPYPAAYTMLGDKSVKIFSAEPTPVNLSVKPGTFETDHTTYLRFAGNDGWLYIKELQQEGKKRMDVVSFLRGYRG